MCCTAFVFISFLLCFSSVCQSNGDVRLVGPKNSSGVGIVEVYLQGVWGSVQPSDYERVGQAACRQLGYADVIYSGSYHDQQ